EEEAIPASGVEDGGPGQSLWLDTERAEEVTPLVVDRQTVEGLPLEEPPTSRSPLEPEALRDRRALSAGDQPGNAVHDRVPPSAPGDRHGGAGATGPGERRQGPAAEGTAQEPAAAHRFTRTARRLMPFAGSAGGGTSSWSPGTPGGPRAGRAA